MKYFFSWIESKWSKTDVRDAAARKRQIYGWSKRQHEGVATTERGDGQ